ncbi:MAG: LytTR family DNA-binding domain-containing protein [Bacteroidota bacterium]
MLKLSFEDLVAMEAANNYITVYYLRAGQLQKKLLRSSLRKMYESVPEMLQVHRSYLVNPEHFVEWKDGQTLVLTQLVVPVSQKHKANLLAMPAFAPK